MLQLRNKGQRNEELENRNIKYNTFLEQLLGKEFTIIGLPNNPAIIHKNKSLSCYIRQDIMRLLDKPKDGKIILELDINKQPDIDKFLHWYKNAEHSPTYRIKVIGAPIYICGMSKYNGNPVFGDLPHYYKTTDFALELISKFSLDYCEVV